MSQSSLDLFSLELYADQLLTAYTEPNQTIDALNAFNVLNARAKVARLPVESLVPVLDLAYKLSPDALDLILVKIQELPYDKSYKGERFEVSS